MASDIQPGAYVRAIGGMYAGATGRVVSIGQSASGPFASVDVGEAHPIPVFVSGLELVGTETPRDRMREGVEVLRDAVANRIAELEGDRNDRGAWLDNESGAMHAELSEVAEALRVILAEGER
jgi:hypothetical protein